MYNIIIMYFFFDFFSVASEIVIIMSRLIIVTEIDRKLFVITIAGRLHDHSFFSREYILIFLILALLEQSLFSFLITKILMCIEFCCNILT